MRRLAMTMSTALLLLTLGCSQAYERRLESTLVRMHYEKRLNDNLMKAPEKTEGKFQDLAIYIRPPKEFKLSKEFTLIPLDPGKFDLEATFIDEKNSAEALHVLARKKGPKVPAKKQAKNAEPAAVRGDFNQDVLVIINSVYGTDLDLSKFKDETKKLNKFKHPTAFEKDNKNVQVFLYGSRTDPYEVALIYEYPKAEHRALVPKIDLSLEAFAVGPKAQRAFSGGSGEEESGEGATGGPGVVF